MLTKIAIYTVKVLLYSLAEDTNFDVIEKCYLILRKK